MDQVDRKRLLAVRALLMGYAVPIDGYRYRLDDEHNLCVELREYVDGKFKPWHGLLGKVDFSLGNFFKVCEKLTDEDANSLVLQITLEKQKGQKQ